MTHIRNISLVVLMLILCNGVCKADTLSDKIRITFNEGVKAYDNGDYYSAVQQFESIYEYSVYSNNIYYNTGSAYYMSGNTGKAILNFLRARFIRPRDRTVFSALEKARSGMKQMDFSSVRQAAGEYFDYYSEMLNRTELTLISVVSYFAASIMVILFFLSIRRRRLMLIAAAGLYIFSLFTWAALENRILKFKASAVVVERICSAGYEPTGDSESFFPLYEGMVVYVVRESGDWTRVDRGDGKIGWVKSSCIERVCQTPDIYG